MIYEQSHLYNKNKSSFCMYTAPKSLQKTPVWIIMRTLLLSAILLIPLESNRNLIVSTRHSIDLTIFHIPHSISSIPPCPPHLSSLYLSFATPPPPLIPLSPLINHRPFHLPSLTLLTINHTPFHLHPHSTTPSLSFPPSRRREGA